MHHSDIEDLAAMVESYLSTALWTWIDDDGHARYGDDAIHVEVCGAFDLRSIVQATDDCRSFCEYVADWGDDDQRHNDRSWRAARQALAEMDPAEAGADFWLTRERHGTGFWDRGLGAAGDRLTSAAHLRRRRHAYRRRRQGQPVMSADNNAPGRPNRAACGECTDGVLIGFTYGFADIPDGAVPVQRCDECCRYRGDEDAAVALARSWDTSWGLAGDPASETAPGDWWVRLPTASERRPFLSESAAVQAWIDGTTIPCLGCGKALDRSAGAWHHRDAPGLCTYTQPAIAWITDAEALDQIGALLATPEWSGADYLDAINTIVIRTGRPAGMAAPQDWAEGHDGADREDA